MYVFFLMIPLISLYNECIDRLKLSEQKNPFEYIVRPSPLKWGSEQNVDERVAALCANSITEPPCLRH